MSRFHGSYNVMSIVVRLCDYSVVASGISCSPTGVTQSMMVNSLLLKML